MIFIGICNTHANIYNITRPGTVVMVNTKDDVPKYVSSSGEKYVVTTLFRLDLTCLLRGEPGSIIGQRLDRCTYVVLKEAVTPVITDLVSLYALLVMYQDDVVEECIRTLCYNRKEIKDILAYARDWKGVLQ